MKKYLKLVGILFVLVNSFLQAQCPEVEVLTKEIDITNEKIREKIDKKIGEKTVESYMPNDYYVLKLNVDVKGFQTLANSCKTYGHKKGSDFDMWKQNHKKTAEYYMFYTVVEGKIYLYYEEINELEDEQYLLKGTIDFDKEYYNSRFGNINFSANHWQVGGDVKERLKDMKELAVNIGKKLGITLEKERITTRLKERPENPAGAPMRMYIPDETLTKKGNIAGEATLNDDITSIELDGYYLQRSISEVVSTTAEETYHKYQISEVKKLMQGIERKEPEKSWNWYDSYLENKRENYTNKIVELQKKVEVEKNPSKRVSLKKQEYDAIRAYHDLAHEKDAKEFAGQVAAVEYVVRKLGNKLFVP
jgi:hypothetical protein